MVNKLKKEFSGSISNGYIKGTTSNQPKNYLQFNNIFWRIIKINTDNSLLIVTNDVYGNPIKFSDSSKIINYAHSSIKDYLNTTFLNSFLESQKSKIKFASWDTREEGGSNSRSGLPNSVNSKIGLLTETDFTSTSDGTPIQHYLSSGITGPYWTMTGMNNGYYVICYDDVSVYANLTPNSSYSVYARPAVVLNSGVTLTCTYNASPTNSSQCNGSLDYPYTIE